MLFFFHSLLVLLTVERVVPINAVILVLLYVADVMGVPVVVETHALIPVMVIVPIGEPDV